MNTVTDVNAKNNEEFQLPNPPFFIVGVGRSGTTLLMSMLNAHPEVTMPPETHFLRRQVIPDHGVGLEKAEERLGEDKYFSRLGFNSSELLEFFREERVQFDWSLLYRKILLEYLEESGGSFIGDKDPKSVEYLPVIKAIFPDAKIIHMVRDPRDVVLSRGKAGWSKDRSWFTHPLAYRVQFQLGRERGRELFGENYLEIKYEELITGPEEILQGVSDFLDIDFSERMLDFGDSAEELVAEDEKSWKKNVTGPLKQDNYRKWENQMERRDVVRIEGICREVFDEGIYEIAYPEITVTEMLERRSLQVTARLASWFYVLRLERKIESFFSRYERGLPG